MRTVFPSVLAFLACLACAPARAPGAQPFLGANQVRTPTGLLYETVVEGSGPAATPGQTVRIHEKLTLPDGKVLFSSWDRGEPVTFLLGGNQVIAGVDEGVTGMRVGEQRRLVVPPALDGRTFDPAFVPPGSLLHYHIELVEIVQ